MIDKRREKNKSRDEAIVTVIFNELIQNDDLTQTQAIQKVAKRFEKTNERIRQIWVRWWFESK